MANKAGFLILAAMGAAAAAVIYYVTRPKRIEEDLEVFPELIEGCLPGTSPSTSIFNPGVCVADLDPSDGSMEDPIEQEDPHFGEPVTIPEDYEVLRQLEIGERKECPWDNSYFDTISANYNHILDVHGGVPGPDRSVLSGKVPLLRYQKIPVLVRLRDDARLPIINQLVELKRKDGAVLQADYTDDNGCVDFLNLDPGEYRITVDALPTYSQSDRLHTFEFLTERVTLHDFSGNPVEMEFMQPYRVDVLMIPPGFSVIEERDVTVTTQEAPPSWNVIEERNAQVEAPPASVSLDSLTIVDALNAARAGDPVLQLKIGRYTANYPVEFTAQDLAKIGQLRG